VRIEGLERVEWSEPLVVIANHQSWFDVFVLAGLLPAHVRFVAKEELGRIPIFGPAWRACGHISLDRSDRKRALESLDRAARKVREDKLALVLFPEGTRSPDGRLWAFKKGAFVLAIKTEVPIVPLGMAGSRAVMPKGSFRVRPGEIRIRVGEPIRVEGMRLEDRDRLLALSRAAVAELIEDADGMVGTAGPADGGRTDDGEEGRA
jgi:1-acyl-sn-glycerol-3-phosphate acyltransferase